MILENLKFVNIFFRQNRIAFSDQDIGDAAFIFGQIMEQISLCYPRYVTAFISEEQTQQTELLPTVLLPYKCFFFKYPQEL